VHGMGRMGERRALKWALEGYWAGRLDAAQLEATASTVRRRTWRLLAGAGIDVVPSNDFSLYDHVLDTAVAVGAVPGRFRPEVAGEGASATAELDRYFAMARGGELAGEPVAPLELTKWFDTNYHHLVPEVSPGTTFVARPAKAVGELVEAAGLGIDTTPVLLGPLTFLVRSAGAAGADPLERLDDLAGVYAELLAELAAAGAEWVRLDEPVLVEDRSADELAALRRAYERISAAGTRPRVIVSTFFGHVGTAMAVLRDLPVEGVGLDFCAGPENLDLLDRAGGLPGKTLLAGVVDGRNVWVNDLAASLALLDRLLDRCGELVVSSSCSFLHVPDRLADEGHLDPVVRSWLAFAEEKLAELSVLARGAEGGPTAVEDALAANLDALASRRRSALVADPAVRRAVEAAPSDPRRSASPAERRARQRARLGLPPLPTTTIGSFPQTPGLRATRAAWRSGSIGDDDYTAALRAEVDRVIDVQETLGFDVLVHGEPERDDMVRYFAGQLTGFALPEEGWVQSFGSRCVRPPILYGDVFRPGPMTVPWAVYAQSRTDVPVKGMLTGPVTMLRWSFVRDDQPASATAAQLGLAIGDELADLQAAGIRVVQVDEPALREGMPLRRAERDAYLAWATRAFRLATRVADPATQVHTHMCYAELADVVDALAAMEVDVVSFEAARSHLTLLAAVEGAAYEGDVGPGVYDVHSPLVPSAADIEALLWRAVDAVGADRLWVNPDCGLKTRGYDETVAALANLVAAARSVRSALADGRLGPVDRDPPARSGPT
jgi:5-methyltetrahydropteroyltriglutamate--homocysteine methyltransferase